MGARLGPTAGPPFKDRRPRAQHDRIRQRRSDGGRHHRHGGTARREPPLPRRRPEAAVGVGLLRARHPRDPEEPRRARPRQLHPDAGAWDRRAGATLQPARVEAGLAALNAMADAVAARGLPRPEIRLEHLLALPGLFDGGQPEDDREALQAAVTAALDQAIAGLEAMKRKEGDETAAEMRARTVAIDRHLGTVAALVPGALEEAQNRLRERLAQLLGDAIEPQRLAQEAAILVDKGNINEECERLASHLEQVREALAEGGQVAKRLNFLFQEMHREVNTMGSKTQNLGDHARGDRHEGRDRDPARAGPEPGVTRR
ncbi:MAG: DUF1732 domain-containing protein [bacterium]|nr:DUF1732 domain-containing protein [bacterium]